MSTAVRPRIPPGRAGRLWLRERLAIAGRGVALLERKLRILRGEQQRLRIVADECDREWRRCAAEARVWSLRAGLAGGQRSLRLATGSDDAAVTVTWAAVMGVRYPAHAEYLAPSAGAGEPVVSAAVVHARAAHRAAVAAAVQQASVQAALRVVERELATTRVRARALSRHWIPVLQAALQDVELALEEQERADRTRLGRFGTSGAAGGGTGG